MVGLGRRAVMAETLQALLGMVLLILVTGIWVCLWVPPTM
jgi:hypothetical protein